VPSSTTTQPPSIGSGVAIIGPAVQQ
jgi:hypothetical protein